MAKEKHKKQAAEACDVTRKASAKQVKKTAKAPSHDADEPAGGKALRVVTHATVGELALCSKPGDSSVTGQGFYTGHRDAHEAETAVPVARHRTDAEQRVFRMLFSDESEAFRSPSGCVPGQWVTVKLRVEESLPVQEAFVLVGAQLSRVRMNLAADDAADGVTDEGLFRWYAARFLCGFEPVTYRFFIVAEGFDQPIVYQKDGAHWADAQGMPAEADAQGTPAEADAYDPVEMAARSRSCDFRVVPWFTTPTWAQGAIQYQIFPDRFANGSKKNDVVDREYAYGGAHVRKIDRWEALPTSDDYRCFYGGDLQGVADKLDYLQSLGVEAIYLNPIFVSPSSHKYDTQDYGHVDPHFAIIADDVKHPLAEGDFSNSNAHQYGLRTTSRENLRQSDRLFAKLCKEIHRRGMKIILDGVFNHCGSFSPWMDREGFYRRAGAEVPGAYLASDSPFRRYFHFRDGSPESYEAWWDFPTLPKLNYEGSAELCDRIIGIARHWAMPPYSIDGWRLDVAADLGHSEEFNHQFWRRFRRELKRVNPDLVIIAEHYGDPSAWLAGDQWDTVMNYDAFMDPLTYFLTGMEKHSDRRSDELYQDGEAFCNTMRVAMARFEWGSLLCAMNELSNHDHSRFLTRTNGQVGRINTAGSSAASEGTDIRVMREAVVVQMTWPGAPTIYYGDEAGQVGWTDPDCRRTYPWGHEDESLIELHRALADVRSQHPALRKGSFALLGGGRGWIAFGRFLDDDRVATVCNNADEDQVIDVYLRELGVADDEEVRVCLITNDDGFECSQRGYGVVREEDDAIVRTVGIVKDGSLRITAPARSAIILAGRTPGL